MRLHRVSKDSGRMNSEIMYRMQRQHSFYRSRPLFPQPASPWILRMQYLLPRPCPRYMVMSSNNRQCNTPITHTIIYNQARRQNSTIRISHLSNRPVSTLHKLSQNYLRIMLFLHTTSSTPWSIFTSSISTLGAQYCTGDLHWTPCLVHKL
jgi:hypothetical protein